VVVAVAVAAVVTVTVEEEANEGMIPVVAGAGAPSKLISLAPLFAEV